MKWFNNLFNSKDSPPLETKSSDTFTIDSEIDGYTLDDIARAISNGKRKVTSDIDTAISIIQRAVSQIKILAKKNGQAIKSTDREFFITQTISPIMSNAKFLAYCIEKMSRNGYAAFSIIRNPISNQISGLIPLYNQSVLYELDPAGGKFWCSYTTNDNKFHKEPLFESKRNILYIGLPSSDPLNGASIVNKLINESNILSSGTEQISKVLENQFATPYIAQTEAVNLSQDQRQAIKDAIKEATNYATRNNADVDPILLSAGVKLAEIPQTTAEQIQLLGILSFNTIRIANLFGIPHNKMVESKTGNAYTSVLEANTDFYKTCISFWISLIFDELNILFSTENITIVPDTWQLISGDVKTQIELCMKLYQSGLLSFKQVCEKLNIEIPQTIKDPDNIYCLATNNFMLGELTALIENAKGVNVNGN